jgi:hypothetical protein
VDGIIAERAPAEAHLIRPNAQGDHYDRDGGRGRGRIHLRRLHAEHEPANR